MPDKQIHPLGDEAAPADYVIPPSAELLLKSVYAKYDGSAAASSFVPLVRIISDAGSTTDEVPQDTTIAAGASADATWFPRVGGGGASAAASSGLPWCFGRNTLSVPGDGSWVTAEMGGVGFHGDTSDSSILSFADDGFGDFGISLNADGIYLVTAAFFYNPIIDRTLKYSANSRLQDNPSGFFDEPQVPFVPDLGGTLASANTTTTGLYNIDPNSTPPPDVVIAQTQQDSTTTLGCSAYLLAYQLNPTGSGNF